MAGTAWRKARLYRVTLLAAALVLLGTVWWQGSSGAAREAVEAVAAFAGVGHDAVRVVHGPSRVKGESGESLVRVTVEYPEPGGSGEARAKFTLDAQSGLVRSAVWPDLFAVGPPAGRPLSRARLQAIAATFIGAHNPVPGSQVHLARASPFPANRETHYTFDWTPTPTRDPVPLGRISTTVRCADGRVASYYYHPMDTEALRRLEVPRDRALDAAGSARLVSGVRHRPAHTLRPVSQDVEHLD